MLISLRGTNGSAKSTVIRTLIASCHNHAIYGALGSRLPEAYQLEVRGVSRPVFILGPYHLTECGGCDRFKYDTVLRLLEKYEPKGHVIFEGVIITSVYGRVGALMEKYKKDSVFVFLNTSLETCLKRVEARSGNSRDERLVKNVTLKFKTAERIRKKVLADGIMRAYSTSAGNAPTLIKKLLADG